jgi:transcriptional regulator with XRE-family HTH domain
MSSYEKFRKICFEREVKPSDVSKATGISSATLSSWKKGIYSPKIDKISKIANFFHIDASYFDDDALTVPVTSARIVSEEEQRLTDIFNRLSSDGKKRLLERAMELEQLGFTEKNAKKEA